MDNNIGDGLPNITSVTINPDTGERYLTLPADVVEVYILSMLLGKELI